MVKWYDVQARLKKEGWEPAQESQIVQNPPGGTQPGQAIRSGGQYLQYAVLWHRDEDRLPEKAFLMVLPLQPNTCAADIPMEVLTYLEEEMELDVQLGWEPAR